MSAVLHHPDTHRLGKNEPKPPRAMLSEFVDIERVSLDLPANIINSAAPGQPAMSISLAMYLNNREGDCTLAGVGNTLRVDSNGAVQITDDDTQTGYVAITGKEGAAFNPATGQNDNGCVELDVLDYWTAIGVGGNKLRGHAGVDMTNPLEVRTALYLCGPVYPGWQLSTDQQSQTIWQPGPAPPGSWGGHCAIVIDWWTQIPAGLVIGGVPIPQTLGEVLDLGTWSTYKPTLPSYLPFACDEGHALITDAWLKRNEGNPAIDQAKLAAYLKTLRPEA